MTYTQQSTQEASPPRTSSRGRRWQPFTLLLALCLAMGCGAEEPGPAGALSMGEMEAATVEEVEEVEESATAEPSSCEQDPVAFLAASCGSAGICHDAAGSAFGLSLKDSTPEQLAAGMVGVPSMFPRCEDRALIDPEDLDASFLLEKLTSDPYCGEPMPYGSEPLSAEERDCVKAFASELVALAGEATSEN